MPAEFLALKDDVSQEEKPSTFIFMNVAGESGGPKHLDFLDKVAKDPRMFGV